MGKVPIVIEIEIIEMIEIEIAWDKVQGLKFQLSFRVYDFPKIRRKKNNGSNLSSRKNVLDLSY